VVYRIVKTNINACIQNATIIQKQESNTTNVRRNRQSRIILLGKPASLLPW
jgi:hypothetical protein